MDFIKLQEFLRKENQPKFRLDQIKKAYFVDLVNSFEVIFNLPKDLREKLTRNFSFSSVYPEKIQKTKNGRTQKALLRLNDGTKVESVLMDYDGWLRFVYRLPSAAH